MTILLTLLALTNLAQLAYLFHRDKTHRAITADLLDRLMARTPGEYAYMKSHATKSPVRRRVLTDAEMAEIEKSALVGRAG